MIKLAFSEGKNDEALQILGHVDGSLCPILNIFHCFLKAYELTNRSN